MRKQVKNLQETYDTAEKGAFVIAITYKFIDLHSTCYMEEYSGNTRIANIVAPHVHAREAWGHSIPLGMSSSRMWSMCAKNKKDKYNT